MNEYAEAYDPKEPPLFTMGFVIGFAVGIVVTLLVMVVVWPAPAHAQRAASYAKQSSSGYPLVVAPPLVNAGAIDSANVAYLARFNDVTMEAAPWAQAVSGAPRADVPLMLRQLNPRIRLWLYVLTGDFWLTPAYKPQASDRSAYRLIFDAINAGNGWLYGVDGAQWWENYRVNLADKATVVRLADVYCKLVGLRLWDGLFMDDAHTSIAWTSKPERRLDVERAGFATLAAMDSARKVNVEYIISRVKAAGPCGFMVATNGTGPKPYNSNVDFREGLGILISEAEATEWMATPGLHWLKSEAWSPQEVEAKRAMLLRCANGRGIVSLGADREWKPEIVR